jgi:hypothetical protein
MLNGSCLCGTVKYEVQGEIGPIVLCHCSRCRKANGSAFAAVAPVKTEDLRILSGQENIKTFESSPGVGRFFCRACGSPLFSKRANAPELLRLRIGTLDTQLPTKPSAHIFAASKAEWFEICDDTPQYAERP